MGRSFFYYIVSVLFQQALFLMAAAVEPGAGAPVGEQLQQDGVGHAAIDDDRLVDSLIDGIGHAADLGIMPPAMIPATL